MSTPPLGRKDDSSPLNLSFQRISGMEAQFAAKNAGKNDLPLGGNPCFHGKTILPHSQRCDNPAPSPLSQELDQGFRLQASAPLPLNPQNGSSGNQQTSVRHSEQTSFSNDIRLIHRRHPVHCPPNRDPTECGTGKTRTITVPAWPIHYFEYEGERK